MARMAKVIRMGLIGCGKMMAAHAKNLNLVEEIEIVACCDLYRDKQTQYEIRHFAQCVNDGTLPPSPTDAPLSGASALSGRSTMPRRTAL